MKKNNSELNEIQEMRKRGDLTEEQKFMLSLPMEKQAAMYGAWKAMANILVNLEDHNDIFLSNLQDLDVAARNLGEEFACKDTIGGVNGRR